MIVEDGTGRLPGDLSPSLALWLVTQANGRLLAWLALLVVIAVVGLRVDALAGLLAAAVLAVVAARGLTSRSAGVEVTAASQPFLYGLVHAAADRVGGAPPDRIRLVDVAAVTPATSLGRRELRVGLPLVSCLTADQLSALVAGRLAVLGRARPVLVCRLYQKWISRVAGAQGPGGRRWRRGSAGVVALDRFGRAAAGTADAAAAGLCGPADAAWALAVEATAGVAYLDFVMSSGGSPDRGCGDALVEDLDDGWRALLEHGVPGDWDEEVAAAVARFHPGLAGELAALGDRPLTLTMPAGRVRLEALSRRQRRRLVRATCDAPARPVRWTSFEQAPARWWIARAARGAHGVRHLAAEVLGGAPADAGELVDVLYGRPGEILGRAVAAALETEPDADLAGAAGEHGDPTAAVALVLEHALLARGWRLEHPAVRGVLLDPTGARLVAGDLAARGVIDPQARREVLALMSGG